MFDEQGRSELEEVIGRRDRTAQFVGPSIEGLERNRVVAAEQNHSFSGARTQSDQARGVWVTRSISSARPAQPIGSLT